MKKISARKIGKIKRRSIIPHIALFILALMIGVIAVAMSTSGIAAYIVEKHYVDSIFSIKGLEKDYKELLSDGQNIQMFLSTIQEDYPNFKAISIRDEQMNTVYSYGKEMDVENDTVLYSDKLELTFEDKSIFSVSDEFDETFELQEILGFKTILQVTEGVKSNNLLKEVFSIEYWAGSEWEENTRAYVLIYQSFTVNDCLFILANAALVGLMFGLFALVCLAQAIKNIVSQRRLIRYAFKDPVTGGNNYLYFNAGATKFLSSPINNNKNFALIDFSLLKFKHYCSLYGTEEGDRLLRVIDKYLKKCLKHGEIHARVNDSDFVMLIRVQNADDIPAIQSRLEEIIYNFKNKISRDNKIVGLKNVRIKSGIYIIRDESTEEWKQRRNKKNLNVDQFYIKAGIAKNLLSEEESIKFYNHDMLEMEKWEQKVEDKMQEALDKEEFSVYIQPKYNPTTHKLAGGEALVRWISPEEGIIPPFKFIPIFEKTGFVTKLDDYMISHTAKLQSQWLSEGKKIVPVSVNVSRAHFAQSDLAEHIRDLVDAYPLPHEYIEIELTESAFFDDKNALLSTVKKLQEYGFEVSMDDFGAGYSSLNSLKDLPLNVLKLDAEFFRGEDAGERGKIVVAQAISLAKQLNMRIVAEGVEKEEQVNFLASKDCDMIQGYYFDKPMPAEEYVTRMETNA